MNTIADVIFPRVLSIYLISALTPWLVILALIAEFYVYFCYQRNLISPIRLLAIVLSVNCFSWLVGVFLASDIPDAWVPQLPDSRDLLSFAWACFLSTVLEYLALIGFQKRLRFRQLGRCVIVANVAGYAVMWTVLKVAGSIK